ncbi:ras and Rab interactor 2 isoform X3 [Festucalex cinctus]
MYLYFPTHVCVCVWVCVCARVGAVAFYVRKFCGVVFPERLTHARVVANDGAVEETNGMMKTIIPDMTNESSRPIICQRVAKRRAHTLPEGEELRNRCQEMQEAGATQPGAQRAFSVLDRLLLTHPVWLQLSLKQESVLYILLREPVGTFLVRKCSVSQRKVLCMRVTADRSSSSVKECFICEEDYTFALESSALSFPDLCRLVAFYCVSRDVLPLPLQLPDAIANATTHRQLESISHMGQDFWNSPSPSELQNGPLASLSSSLIQVEAALDRWRVQGHSSQGKLCFINPLFLQLEVWKQSQLQSHSASNKRHRFKRSMRLRLSESSMNLSLEGVGSYSPPPSIEMPGGSDRLRDSNSKRRVHAGAGVLRRTPALSPGSAGSEEEDMMVARAPQVEQPLDVRQPIPADAPAIEVALLAPERRPAPSLAELDSNSSFSSLDEENDSDSDCESGVQTQTQDSRRPPLVRSRGRGGLHRMSEAFVCFFAPDKRLARLVQELSRDRRSIFGATVQDFLLAQTGLLKSVAAASPSSPRVTSVQLLEGVRLFLSQAKFCLLESGELEPPIETLVPESEKDLALERAMFSCVLRPLKSHLDKALVALHQHDASSQRFQRNLLRLKGEGAAERLGMRMGVPDGRQVDKVKRKLALMRRTHSPVDKVLLLLQICKCVQKGAGTAHAGQEVSWEDFLPSLSYVIVESNKPHILMEVEYMMELLLDQRVRQPSSDPEYGPGPVDLRLPYVRGPGSAEAVALSAESRGSEAKGDPSEPEVRSDTVPGRGAQRRADLAVASRREQPGAGAAVRRHLRRVRPAAVHAVLAQRRRDARPAAPGPAAGPGGPQRGRPLPLLPEDRPRLQQDAAAHQRRRRGPE